MADRLGVGETLLDKFMAGTRPLPDALTLMAVDIILADRDARMQTGEMPLRSFDFDQELLGDTPP